MADCGVGFVCNSYGFMFSVGEGAGVLMCMNSGGSDCVSSVVCVLSVFSKYTSGVVVSVVPECRRTGM